ncbi:hypothetical protein M758_4G231300 [Ceratodon purpureus]|nr:hypothetical protein M758_4G231300 [Ceratodon purpureus]
MALLLCAMLILFLLCTSHEVSGLISLSSPLSADIGQYVMKVAIGTPPQEFSLILDTGSDLTWIQCSPCPGCFNQPDPFFEPTASSTFSPVPCTNSFCRAFLEDDRSFMCNQSNTGCNYQYGYEDGSLIRGELAYDVVSLPSEDSASVALSTVIGCIHNETMPDFANADGIVGLSRGLLSLPSQFSNHSVAHVFSYCLVDILSRGSISSRITFGEEARNPAAALTPMIFVPGSDFYYVEVEGISIGGRRIGVPTSTFHPDNADLRGVYLDSGTTYSQWRTEAFTPMLAAIRQQITYQVVDAATTHALGVDLCFDVSNELESNIILPDMVVHMRNVEFEIPALPNLFRILDGYACLLMTRSTSGISLIGAAQQQNKLIVYDVENKQIGFLAAQCGTAGPQ